MPSASPVPAADLQRLNDRFAIPGVAQIVAGSGGLAKVRVTSAAAEAEVYLHGAHLTSWIPAGAKQVIFLSDKAQFQDGKAIRGGVPICFPWFNAKADNPKAPSHGFVRTKAWDIESITHEGNAIAVALSTSSDESTRKWWPYDFHLVQKITISNCLLMELTVSNTGTGPFTFQEALHTYYHVGSVREVRLAGLNGASYLDNADGLAKKVQHGDNSFTQRTDNAYFDTSAEVRLTDSSLRRRLSIAKKNSLSTVVWNPWAELAQGMADLGAEEWEEMLCVETANIHANAVTVQPNDQHTMTAVVQAETLG
jgi:glucose-6-phosphate 1-epimerase